MANRLGLLTGPQYVQRHADARRKPQTWFASVWMDDQGGTPAIRRSGALCEAGDFGLNVFLGNEDGRPEVQLWC